MAKAKAVGQIILCQASHCWGWTVCVAGYAVAMTTAPHERELRTRKAAIADARRVGRLLLNAKVMP